MHVPLRRRRVLVPGQLLDRPRRCPSHREMRTERVPQDVDAVAPGERPARRPLHEVPDVLLCERMTVLSAEDPRPPKVPMDRERACKPYRHRYDPGAAPLGQRHVAFPLGPLDHDLPFRQVDIGPLQGHDLATAKSGVSTQKHGEMGLWTHELRRLDQALVRGEVVERGHRLGRAEQRDLARYALDYAPFDRFPKKKRACTSRRSRAPESSHVRARGSVILAVGPRRLHRAFPHGQG